MKSILQALNQGQAILECTSNTIRTEILTLPHKEKDRVAEQSVPDKNLINQEKIIEQLKLENAEQKDNITKL